MKVLARKVVRNEATSIEDMPSYAEVMRFADMKFEAFSLMVLRT